MTRLRYSPPLLSALDSTCALGLAVATVLWVNHAHIPFSGVATFLRIRITLLNLSFAVVFGTLWKQCFAVLDLYNRDLEGVRRLVGRAATGCGLMTGLLAWYLQARHARGPISEIVVDFLIAAFAFELCRIAVYSRHVNWRLSRPERVIILGSGRLASRAWRELRVQDPGHRTLLGFVDDRGAESMAPDIASRLLGKVEDLPLFLARNAVDELIVAAPMRSCYDLSQRAVAIAEAAGVRVVCLQDVFTLTCQKHTLSRTSVFVEMLPGRQGRLAGQTAKRLLGAARS